MMHQPSLRGGTIIPEALSPSVMRQIARSSTMMFQKSLAATQATVLHSYQLHVHLTEIRTSTRAATMVPM